MEDIYTYQNVAETVLKTLKVNQDLYNIAQETYGSGEQGMKEMVQVSMISPFIPDSKFSFNEALEMFASVSDSAIRHL